MRKIVIGVLAATLLAAACGSSSKSGSSGGTSKTNAGGGSSGGNALSELVAKASKADVKIKYKDKDGKVFTIAQDGKGKSLYATDSSVFISDGSSTISCDGTGSSASCTQLPSGTPSAATSILAAYSGIFTAIAQLSSDKFGHVTSETIAGRDATCATIKASDIGGVVAGLLGGSGYNPNASLTVCVDKQNGFLLRFSDSDGSTTTDELVATEAGPSSASDFEPPSTPSTISIPGGITVPTT